MLQNQLSIKPAYMFVCVCGGENKQKTKYKTLLGTRRVLFLRIGLCARRYAVMFFIIKTHISRRSVCNDLISFFINSLPTTACCLPACQLTGRASDDMRYYNK